MEEKFADRPIVVGYDGSQNALLAVRWAVGEAVRLDARLAFVYALHWFPEFAEVTSPETDRRVRDRAQQIADEAMEEAARLDPRPSVTAAVVSGNPATVLTDLSQNARMLVMGSRGHGGLAGMIAGSVSVAVATHAHCPVVVVRELPADPGGRPVAVGVDGSPQTALALDFAFAEAQARRVEVLAVRAWRPPKSRSDPAAPSRRAEQIAEAECAERRFLHDIIQPVAARYRGVPVEERVVDQRTATALIDIATKVQLMVVGSRGHGGFAGLLLGSVGMQLLHHARCPVAIVRESATPAAEPVALTS